MNWPRVTALGTIVVGLMLLAIGFTLPSSRFIRDCALQIESAVDTTADQIALVRQSLDEVDGQGIAKATDDTAQVSKLVAEAAQRTSIDFDIVDNAATTLAGIAGALESLDPILAAAASTRMSEEFEKAAVMLEEQVAPMAKTSAETLSTLATRAEQQAKSLGDMLRDAKLDANAVVDVSKALAGFSEALKGADEVAETVKQQFPLISKDLSELADKLRDMRSTWAAYLSGGKSALDDAAAGIEKLVAVVDTLNSKLIPSIVASMSQSNTLMTRLAEGSRTLSEHRSDLDRLLKDGPDLLVSLGTEIGTFGRRVAELVGETSRITVVAKALRASAGQLRDSEAGIPQIRKILAATAVTVRATQQKTALISQNRDAFEELGPRTAKVLAATSRALEEAKGTVANKLTREKEILARVETNCAQFRGFLPRFQSTIGLFFDLVKWSTSGIGVFLTISGVRKLTTIA